MAFSLNPPSTSSKFSSSRSLYFLLPQHKTHFSYSAKPLRNFTISCSQRLVQLDADQRNQPPPQPRRVKVSIDVAEKRTKRKPKPSFLEQIQDKWSAKVGSRRDKFPWQEQRELEEENDSVTEPETELETRIEPKASTLSDSVGFGLRTTGVVSAPWTHGSGATKPFKPRVDSIPTAKENRGNNNSVHRFDDAVVTDVSEPSNEFRREFDSQSNEVQEEDSEEEKEMVSMGTEGYSLGETVNGNKKDGNLWSFGYDSGGLARDVAESESESESGEELKSTGGHKMKWKRSNTVAAEKTLPEHELKRLRNVSLRMVGRIKVGARGITQALVDTIHEKWELDEVVKLKFEEPLSLNMRRTHGILENKTGGLVIWRSGSSAVLYRGMTYNLPCVKSYTKQNPTETAKSTDLEAVSTEPTCVKDSAKTLECSTPIPTEHVKVLSDREIQHLNDLNDLLDELGPRFTDWLGRQPVPVDADLLPGLVPDYKTPFRLLPYGVRHCVGNKTMTRLRRIARTMPPHFALGRNRELQGLAKAMAKLWEKSAIAKIAIKRGVENTRNERMAEELKMLTGGTLLSRNKDYIVFYRGNDFLPPAVTETLKERRKLRDLEQDKEEQVRQMAPDFIESKTKASIEQLVAGTLAETKAATARWGNQPSSVDVEKMMRDSSLARREAIIRHLQKKLALAKGNLTKANKALAKLQEGLSPSDAPDDLETITDEERVLFRKMGLSMKPFLLLGRRGFYGGTVENIHLHWKHRELVKVIMKAKHLEQVKHVANCLEAESGGVLVSVDRTLKGYAIIIYRGKNYQRPDKIRPRNLLTRRQALARSTGVQRREALRHHISDLKERIDLLNSELEESRNGKTTDDGKSLNSTVEDAFLSDDEVSEDDEDDIL